MNEPFVLINPDQICWIGEDVDPEGSRSSYIGLLDGACVRTSMGLEALSEMFSPFKLNSTVCRIPDASIAPDMEPRPPSL